MRYDDEIWIRLQQFLHVNLGEGADLRQLFYRRIDVGYSGKQQPFPVFHDAGQTVSGLQLQGDVERVVHKADDAFHLLRNDDAAPQLVDDDAFIGRNTGGARVFGCGLEEIDIKNSRIYLVADPSVSKSVGEVMLKGISSGWGNVCATSTIRPQACPPHFTVIFAEVDVDTITGKVDIVRVVAGADAGTIMNLNNVEGQIVGGVHMGAGYALMEDTVFDKKSGRPLNAQFGDYKILTSMDMPPVEVITEETWEPTGPLGAKGVGEGVTNPVAPAIANAIYDACGVRIPDLPCTPEKVLDALWAKEA